MKAAGMEATQQITADKIRRYATDPMAFLCDLIIPSAHGPRRFGDVMTDFQRERFAALAPALLAVANGTKPPIGRHWWEATKGASKDSDLAACLLWLMAFTKRSLNCQVGAADADQAGELRKAAKLILGMNPWLNQRVQVQSWRIVCETTSSECEIIAADVAGSHGARPDVLILNELSHIAKQEFAENLMDNAAKVPGGIVVIATNAGFVDTWQWKWRQIAANSPDRWSFHKWARPSPWLDPAEMAEAEQRNSRSRYQRLWWGVWATGNGDALSPEDLEAAIDRKLQPMTGRELNYGYVAGLDLATRRDHAACVGVGLNVQTLRLRLAFSESWAPVGNDGKIDLPAVRDAVIGFHRQFGLSALLVDPHQASLMVADFQAVGINAVEVPFVGKNLDTMASTLVQVFKDRLIDLYDDRELIRDLGRLSIVERAFGLKLEAPRDRVMGHCDKAIALALCLPFASEAATNVPDPEMEAAHQRLAREFEWDLNWYERATRGF